VRLLPGLAATLLLSLLLAACGGGMSKEEVVKEGDKICQKASDEIDKVEEPRKIEDVKTYGPKVSEIVGSAVDDLKELDPPDEGKKDFDAFLAAAEEQADVADKLKDAEGEQEVQELLTKAGESDSKGKTAAKAYGFKACAESG